MLSVKREVLILLRDEAKLGLKFRVDNNFLRMEVESLKRELALVNAEKNGKDSIIGRYQNSLLKSEDNNLLLKKQISKYKRPNRIVIGPGYGVGIGNGMIHHAVGLHATVNIFSFLRL